MNPSRFGGGFDPSTVSGLILHLDANLGITKDGGNLVSNWVDQSAEVNTVVQATGTNQPLWVDSVINGLPIIRFDGVDNFMGKTTFTSGAISQPNTIYLVTTPDTGSSGRFFDSWTNREMGWSESGSVDCAMYAGTIQQTVNPYTGGTAMTIFKYLFNGASSAIEQEDVSLALPASTVGTQTMSGVTLASAAAGDSAFGGFDLAYMLIYDSNVSSVDDTYIVDGLKAKFAI